MAGLLYRELKCQDEGEWWADSWSWLKLSFYRTFYSLNSAKRLSIRAIFSTSRRFNWLYSWKFDNFESQLIKSGPIIKYSFEGILKLITISSQDALFRSIKFNCQQQRTPSSSSSLAARKTPWQQQVSKILRLPKYRLAVWGIRMDTIIINSALPIINLCNVKIRSFREQRANLKRISSDYILFILVIPSIFIRKYILALK